MIDKIDRFCHIFIQLQTLITVTSIDYITLITSIGCIGGIDNNWLDNNRLNTNISIIVISIGVVVSVVVVLIIEIDIISIPHNSNTFTIVGVVCVDGWLNNRFNCCCVAVVEIYLLSIAQIAHIYLVNVHITVVTVVAVVAGVGDWRNNAGLNPIIIINVRYIGCICLHYHCTLFTIVIIVIAGGYCCCVCAINCCCLHNYT